MGYNRCPNCNASYDPAHFGRAWMLKNSAMATNPSPSSRLRGLRQSGWYNVAINITAPPGARVTRATYFFHPAFSSASIELDKAPFTVVLRLCSNSVSVVLKIDYIDVATGDMRSFSVSHLIEKTNCTRLYFERVGPADHEYNGHTGPIACPESFFSDLLNKYNRPDDYYAGKPQVPSGTRRGSKLLPSPTWRSFRALGRRR